jgi:hypothetical protein
MLDERNTSTTPPGQEPASLDDDKLTYTLAEAASRLGISTSLAYEAAHRGERLRRGEWCNSAGGLM